MPDSLIPLKRLMMTLQERAETRPAGSYTTKLLAGGPDKIGGKIREEADELIQAASETGDQGRAHSLDEVAAELMRREGTSGVTEKASRPASAKPKP